MSNSVISRMKGRLGSAKQLDKLLADLKAHGYRITRNKGGGFAEAAKWNEVALRAIEKSTGGPWIIMFKDTNDITWKFDD